jgi:tetratricopeptide (TPR) repeat protein
MAGDEYLNEALKHFKYVYDLDKNDYDALIGLSQVYEKRGDIQLAIEYAESASKLSEAPVNCLYFLVKIVLILRTKLIRFSKIIY